jgi:hypothetical protein
MTDSTRDFFDTLAKVLLRCWVIGFIVLMIWFGAVMLAGDFVYGVHGNMFDLTRPQLNSIHYCGMGLLKLVVAMFFFVPWIAIRLVLRKAKF